MKALTVHPEHAELFRLRLRTIETRSGRTNYRGQLLLHASQRDPDSAAAQRDPLNRAAMAAIPHGNPLTRGSAVAVAELVGCVPIDGFYRGREAVVVRGDGTAEHVTSDDAGGEGVVRDITDQLPFGDFTPRRWAWLLADIRPLPEPIPCRGRQSLWPVLKSIREMVA